MKIIKQIFLFSLSFISIFTICEIFIRTSNLASVSSTEFYNDIGRGRRRNLDYLYFNEGFGIGKYNEERFIGESYSVEKRQNVIRIALLGDSYVESFQIFERDYFGEIAKNNLEKIYPEQRFEFLNFGRSGFDIANIYAYHKTFVNNFNPDYILYMISNGDLEPNYKDPLRPKTIIERDSLIVSFNFNSKEIELFEDTKFLTQNSAILNMLNNGRKKMKTTPVLAILLDKIYYLFNPKQNIETEVTEENKDYNINPVTARIIESIDSNKIIIVNRDLIELPREFQRLCNQNGFNYLDLSKAFKRMKAEGNDPNEWIVTKKGGHWNQKAHKVVGEEIARKLHGIIDYE